MDWSCNCKEGLTTSECTTAECWKKKNKGNCTGNCSGNLTDDKYVWCEMKMFIPCPTGNMPDYDEESGEFPDCPCENN